MGYEKLINYLERKTADARELQAASAIIGLRQRVAELEAVLRECREALSDICQVSAVHHTNGEVTVVAADASPNSKRVVAKIDEVLK